MVPSTERDSELVTDLAAQRPGLGESKMVRVRGLAAAHEARLLGDIAKVLPVAIAARRRDCQHALIDGHFISATFNDLPNRVQIDDASRLVDGRGLYRGDLVLTQRLAHDVDAARERRVAEAALPFPWPAAPDGCGQRFFRIDELGLRLGQGR